jgi:2-methylisocitrate lyase-like PEP mutase family enzyme
MLGVSIPPFDMIWLMETIRDHVENVRQEENQQKISNKIKENRLLYELGEITKEEYEKRNGELNNKLRMNNRINRTNLNQRINILG